LLTLFFSVEGAATASTAVLAVKKREPNRIATNNIEFLGKWKPKVEKANTGLEKNEHESEQETCECIICSMFTPLVPPWPCHTDSALPLEGIFFF